MFSTSKVVSLGVHIVDVLGRPVSELPAGQNLALLEEIRMTVAGTATGAAIDMAKLGIEVVAMGAIGQDEIGEFLVGVMRRYGIDTSHLNRKAGVQTSSTMLPIRPNGERPALHVIGANGELTWEDIDLEAVAQASFLHLGGTPLLLKLDGEPASRVLRHAREHGVTTTYDLLGIPDPKLAQMVEVCLPYVDYSGARIMNGTVLKGHRMLKTDPHSQSAGFTHKAGPAGTATGRPTGPGTAI